MFFLDAHMVCNYKCFDIEKIIIYNHAMDAIHKKRKNTKSKFKPASKAKTEIGYGIDISLPTANLKQNCTKQAVVLNS
jgi:hypothetical protein